MLLRAQASSLADRISPFLRKAALPLLLVMISVFIIKQRDVLALGATTIALAAFLLIFLTMSLGLFLGWIARLKEASRRTILIEVGMQNVAQAMAISTSPFLMADAAYAIPAVFYAVVMNLVLLSYLAWLAFRNAKSSRAGLGQVRTGSLLGIWAHY